MQKNKKYRFYGLLLYYFLRILTSTLRVKVINKNEIDTKKAFIYGFWHSKLIAPSVFFKITKKKLLLLVHQKMEN